MAPRTKGDGDAIDHQRHIKREKPKCTDQPKLLRQHGKNKIGLLFGQKAMMALASQQKPFSEHAT